MNNADTLKIGYTDPASAWVYFGVCRIVRNEVLGSVFREDSEISCDDF